MEKVLTHVCLVSGQGAPNLLPLLDDAIKPKLVELLVSPEMQERAGYLEQILTPRGIKVRQHCLCSAADFDAIQNLLLELIEENQSISNSDTCSIALNVTGGTKWMAIAAQEVFRIYDLPVFYVDIQGDVIRMLGKNQKAYALSNRIGLKDYLHSYGYSIIGESKPQGLKHREVCETLVAKVSEWEGALGQINLLASTAQMTANFNVKFRDCGVEPNTSLSALIAELKGNGLLAGASQEHIEFTDELAREFANGGWLEMYVNSLLNSLKGEGVIQDSPCANLEISSQKGSKNELDVAFMARNHLHLIECKTKNLSHGDVGADTLYKLDSLSELGGLSTRTMLVSYRRLRKADRQRAKDLRINTVEAGEIQNLKAHLRKWIAG